MMAPTDSEPGQQIRDVVADLANDLLDTFYGAHPTATAYGCDVEGIGTDSDGTFYLGRENGADGAESDAGFDYLYRRYTEEDDRGRPQDETAYVFGNYGWMDGSELEDEVPYLRQLFADAVEEGFLDEGALDHFDEAVDAGQRNLRQYREQFDLSDIAALFRDHDVDTLRTLLAHGDEEGRVVWCLCHSKDADGEHIDNPIEVPVISEQDQFMFVRAERYYYDEDAGEGEHYAYGAVVGYDDTPERFFVHRVESDPDLRDPETEWTPALVKEKLGFDANLHEVETSDLPYRQRIRMQGDLTVVRHDWQATVEEQVSAEIDTMRKRVARDYFEDFLADNPRYDEADGLRTTRRMHLTARPDGTEGLKTLQSELGIDEEEVRSRMRDGWQQLTAKRRAQLIVEVVEDRAAEYGIEQSDRTVADLRRNSRATVEDDLTDTDDQVNDVLGNHTLILGPAVENPRRLLLDYEDARGIYAVPEGEEATLYLIHDEHDDKTLTLGPGVYVFGFLNGYEDEWWMSQ